GGAAFRPHRKAPGAAEPSGLVRFHEKGRSWTAMAVRARDYLKGGIAGPASANRFCARMVAALWRGFRVASFDCLYAAGSSRSCLPHLEQELPEPADVHREDEQHQHQEERETRERQAQLDTFRN